MLDHCLALRKNGVLLWRQSWAPLKGNPVDNLIWTVLMEVRRCTALLVRMVRAAQGADRLCALAPLV